MKIIKKSMLLKKILWRCFANTDSEIDYFLHLFKSYKIKKIRGKRENF